MEAASPAKAVAPVQVQQPPSNDERESRANAEENAALRTQLAQQQRHIEQLRGANAKLQQRCRVLTCANRDLKAFLARLPWATEADVAFYHPGTRRCATTRRRRRCGR